MKPDFMYIKIPGGFNMIFKFREIFHKEGWKEDMFSAELDPEVPTVSDKIQVHQSAQKGEARERKRDRERERKRETATERERE